MRVNEAVETGKRFEKATIKEIQCKVMIPLKEEDGINIAHRERILERCAEIYQNLYEDTVQNFANMESEEVLSKFTGELEKA